MPQGQVAGLRANAYSRPDGQYVHLLCFVALGDSRHSKPIKTFVLTLFNLKTTIKTTITLALHSHRNVGNFITDRTSSRVLAPPGGGSQITFG